MRSPNQYILAIRVKGCLLTMLFAFCSVCASAQNESRQKKIIVHILDENGRPTAARIRITARDSIYIAPEGHTVDFPITEQEGDLG